jgi:hypothetical protein
MVGNQWKSVCEVLTVEVGIIISKDNIYVIPILVLDEQIGQSRTVGDKLTNFKSAPFVANQFTTNYLRFDAAGTNCVSSVCIRGLGRDSPNKS